MVSPVSPQPQLANSIVCVCVCVNHNLGFLVFIIGSGARKKNVFLVNKILGFVKSITIVPLKPSDRNPTRLGEVRLGYKHE